VPKGYASGSQVARSTPFDNSTNGFVSVETQSAIEEAKTTAANASRGFVSCGFDGNASSGRWLEFATNIASNLTPFIVPEPGVIRAISLGTNGNSTCTVTLFKNGIAITTLSTSASSANRNKTLNLSVTDLDKLSVQVTSGSCNRPMFYIFIQTL